MAALSIVSARSMLAGDDLRWSEFLMAWTGIALGIRDDFATDDEDDQQRHSEPTHVELGLDSTWSTPR